MFGLVKTNKLKELQEKYDKIQYRIEKCEKIESNNRELQNEINSLKNELYKIKKQIREQTEADLFYTSAKIQKKLLDGEPKENINELLNQQAVYQQMLLPQQQLPYPSSSLLSIFGLGGLFGRRY